MGSLPTELARPGAVSRDSLRFSPSRNRGTVAPNPPCGLLGTLAACSYPRNPGATPMRLRSAAIPKWNDRQLNQSDPSHNVQPKPPWAAGGVSALKSRRGNAGVHALTTRVESPVRADHPEDLFVLFISPRPFRPAPGIGERFDRTDRPRHCHAGGSDSCRYHDTLQGGQSELSRSCACQPGNPERVAARSDQNLPVL